jgi:hypothetical protein
MKLRLQLAIGFCIYVVAFLLPAIQSPGGGPGAGPGTGTGPVAGWFCALIALFPMAALVRGQWAGVQPEALLLAASGLTNPLLLIYLLLRIWPRLVKARLVVGVLVLAGIVSSWVFMSKSSFKPLIGHYLWVAGIVIMLATEIWSLSSVRKSPGASD